MTQLDWLRTQFDPFVPGWTHLYWVGHVWTHLDLFGSSWTMSDLFDNDSDQLKVNICATNYL